MTLALAILEKNTKNVAGKIYKGNKHLIFLYYSLRHNNAQRVKYFCEKS